MTDQQTLPTPDAALFAPGGPLATLAPYKQFVVWRLERRKGQTKPAKVPFDPATGRAINAQNPATWMTWQDALAQSAKHGLGVGLVLTKDDPFFCVDLDNAAEDGDWADWALDIFRMFPGAYVELSHSRQGLHIFGTATNIPDRHLTRSAQRPSVEVYTHSRFIALTGTDAEGNAASDCSDALRRLLASFPAVSGGGDSFDWTDAPASDWSGPAEDKELIEKMLSADGGPAQVFGVKATFRQLWEADANALASFFPANNMDDPYDQSAGDMALASHLAFWTGRDCERMDRLMRKSALDREKWERADYLAKTIMKACAGCKKVYTGGKRESPQMHTGSPDHGIEMRTLADVKSEKIEWLWPGRIPLGKVSMLVGDPGLGKSLVTLSIAAAVSQGRVWPVNREGEAPRGDVLLISAEDDAADTIRPRLDAAGANCRRTHILDGVKDAQGRLLPWSMERLDVLENMLSSLPDLRLVIIDPVSAYLGGGTDSHRNSDIRALLGPLSSVAARYRVAILCVSHLNKGSGPAMYRTTGSLAFTAAARAVYAIAKDPTEPARRLILPVKANLAPDVTGVAYRIATTPDGLPISEWETEPVKGVDVDAVLSGPKESGRPDCKLQDGINWLTELLSDGPVPARQIKTYAKDAGISWRTVERAKVDLKVIASREGEGRKKPWYWRLPDGGGIDSQKPRESDFGGLFANGHGPDNKGLSESEKGKDE